MVAKMLVQLVFDSSGPPHQSLGKGQNSWQRASSLFLRLPASKGSRAVPTTACKYLTQMIACPTNLKYMPRSLAIYTGNIQV
jgi:hypothetical protein